MPLNKTTKLLIKKALTEDIGKRDITTLITVKSEAKGEATIIAKDKGILCGLELARETFKQTDKRLKFKAFKKDGMRFSRGQKIAVLSGNFRSILTAERVALNFLSLLSGVSTLTRKFVDKTKKTRVKILDTRKTIPGLRALQKYAVRTGGGASHRQALDKGIIVKDNHLRVTEDKVSQLISNLKNKTSLPIEIEVENIKEFKSVIKYKPDIIMLDNFSLSQVKTAVALRNRDFPKVKLEASGGITLSNLKTLVKTGLDFISVGALTHSAPNIDFSLEVK
jgi:nicotinate-nucleotide pyrophosphorylase (carboxylating)